MVQILQHRRNTTVGLQSERGSIGEIIIDTNKNTVVVMDGATNGGTPLAKESDIPTDVSDLTDTEGLLGGGGSSGDVNQLISDENNNTFSVTNTGDAVFSGDLGGVNRGLVWDYGDAAGGENSTVRQDVAGLSVRAWTEVGDGVYSAPVNIVTNQGENQKNWVFDGDGDLSLPAGGLITERIVTDNPTIELTPANSSVESQKLVIKGGGGYYTEANGIWINLSNITFQVGDTVNAYIGAETYAGQTLYWWIVPEESGISDPGFGTVTLDESGLGNFSFEVDSEDEFTVRVSQVENVYDPTTGVESLTINGDVGDHHLHLTTGALNETSIILGTDEHNVRTTIEGKIQITTPGESSNVWEFDTDGNLTLPGGITIGNLNGVPAIQGNVDTPIGILAQGSTGAATLQWVDDFENATSISAVVVNSQFANTGDVQIITGNVGPTPEHSWTFDGGGALTFPDTTVQTTAYPGIFTGYDNEIHVSQTDGDDTTGNGDLLKPVASITKALTLVTGGRLTVVVHPGTYTESPTTSVTNITIATTELTGANTLLNGTLTLGAAARISGLKMSNLTLNTSGNVYISNCTVDTRLIKSGSGYTEIINSELQCSSGCQFTGAGQVFINGNKIFSPSVSNASASVTIRGANQIVTPSVTAGVLTIENSVVVSSSPSSNAITSSASSIVTLANSFVLNSAGTSVERIALSGFYSILNVVYDKANSTLAASSGTGGSTNSVDYFQYINADRLILASGGQITFPDATVQTTAWTGEAPYTNGANSGVWGDPVPTTVSEAIDRIANALYALGANTAI